MRSILVALLLALLPFTAGCVQPSLLGNGCTSELPTSFLTVNVTGTEEPLRKVVLLSEPGFDTSAVCTSLPDAVVVWPNETGLMVARPVVQQDYFEARLYFNTTLLRVASYFPLRHNGTLAVNYTGNETDLLAWNGTASPVWREERYDNVSALDDVTRLLFLPLDSPTHREVVHVNSSWNRGATLLLTQRPQGVTVGATLTARIHAPNGTVVHNATVNDKVRGPLFVRLPELTEGNWTITLDSRRGFEAPGRLGFEAEIRFRY